MKQVVFMVAAIIGACFLIVSIIILNRKRRKFFTHPINEADRQILESYVIFYITLKEEDKVKFEHRMLHFLATTKITGVNIIAERLDELLIAASAIIPIFHFPEWQYINLNEVLLYPGSFDEGFKQEGHDRPIAGMVGDGPYQNIMILSQNDLRNGFINRGSMHNTGIHEFVHLVDKTDGAIDGLPESLIAQPYIIPWLKMMQHNIEMIRNDASDIDTYGATNQAEFFAVVSEYFFEQPGLLAQNHPELYMQLRKIFRHE